MAWSKHRHFWRLQQGWQHPRGYLFYCRRCEKQGLYAHKFIRLEDFWGKSTKGST